MSKLVFTNFGDKTEEILESSFKTDCDVRQYTDSLKVEDFDVSSLTHLTFVWHYPGYSSLPFFPDEDQYIHAEPIEEEEGEPAVSAPEPYKEEYRYFSNNLISMFRNLPSGAIVDLLTCSLNDPDFKASVEKIEQDLGINIRYSLDQTGNSPQGNWVLESDGTDVKDVYFTDAIDEWGGVLTTARTIVDMSGVEGFDLSGTDTLILTQNVVWSTVMNNADYNNTDYIALGANQVFDGQGFKIDMGTLTGCPGLFSCSNVLGQPSIIKNLGVLGGSTADYGGFIVRKEQKYFEVDNCYSTGDIGQLAGGICGQYAGYNNGTCTVTNCYSTGDISLSAGGGCG